MLKYDKNRCKREAEVFKALGHPTRLWIVKQLADGEHCVCEFVEAVGVDFSTISQHLAILKRAGVIEDDKRGKSVFYRLVCPCILSMLACLENK
ncbi:putative HTH-type transcriptional regulator [bioreactor metagenome]|uniref:Putative HTH-type transcriptional regulator n=1 Tax=bioreactor metagenome TaxID=1076179 RepID=A0A645I4P5_9ZZZZ|nr:metalloregulator ArsR/SmtB family transcription factor [Victivallaceae bacterium]